MKTLSFKYIFDKTNVFPYLQLSYSKLIVVDICNLCLQKDKPGIKSGSNYLKCNVCQINVAVMNVHCILKLHDN